MREAKEWEVRGFKEDLRIKIDSKLITDEYSYWFRFRSLHWFRKRKIKGSFPKNTIEKALRELNIKAYVWKKEKGKQISSYWLIEPD